MSEHQYLRVRNWEKWQSYRRDRGQPPWVKVWRRLLLDADFVALSDAERGHLMCLWILAADHDGVITSDKKTLKKLCHLDKAPNIQRLVDAGWLEYADSLTPERRHDDANMASTRRPRSEEVRGGQRRGGHAAPSRRSVPPGDAVAGHDESANQASPRQWQFAHRLLAPRGVTVDEWLAKNGHTTLLDSHIDLIRAEFGGRQDAPATESDSQQLRPMFENLDFEFADRGPSAARAWIDTQPAKYQDALRRRLAVKEVTA